MGVETGKTGKFSNAYASILLDLKQITKTNVVDSCNPEVISYNNLSKI